MVKIMENPISKWMIWGENPLFLETSISKLEAHLTIEKGHVQ